MQTLHLSPKASAKYNGAWNHGWKKVKLLKLSKKWQWNLFWVELKCCAALPPLDPGLLQVNVLSRTEVGVKTRLGVHRAVLIIGGGTYDSSGWHGRMKGHSNRAASATSRREDTHTQGMASQNYRTDRIRNRAVKGMLCRPWFRHEESPQWGQPILL